MGAEADKAGASAVESIFLAALPLPATERSAYLADACRENPQLRRRVEALLKAHEAPEGFLPEQPGVASAGVLISPPAQTAPLSEQPGDTIGRYKLLQKIGEGGCGVVYMAEQLEPVRRRVALKIIKLGMDTQQVVARFEAERQALALMDHPNIARVLDAGATDLGRPYFVMELVGGIAITDFCDQNHLSTQERLNLFMSVCRAIQHAHQKGIIHRDIKPSNVLVSRHDGVAVPKVIDFGIAKATQGRLTDQTLFTAFEQFMGTPAYMSPEQAQVGGVDVDTRSDIYSLGVLLYELLTGNTPFDAKELLRAGLDAMRRTIQEAEPVRPSTRLSTMAGADLRRAAERRQSDALKLIHLVRGDLDWIVMKCLEKDRGRRYETANGLARDIERHLDQEPVVARPPSTLYALHKFIRRNRVIAAAATAIATVLVLGIAVSAWETAKARRAERDQRLLRQEAQAAKRDATEQLWRAYLAEARALRMSGQAGRHFDSLEVLRKAAAIRPSPALRNEAIASMILPDIRSLGEKNVSKTPDSVSLEPSFERYAACEPAGVVSVRRLADDREVTRLPDIGVAAKSVAGFSPDGKLLAAGYTDHRWRFWDWAKLAIIMESEVFSGVGFTPDSKTLAISDTTNIVLFDAKNGKRLRSFSLNGLASPRAPGWFRFDPAGRRLALFNTEADTNVTILDIQAGQILNTLQHADHVEDAAWHPDGRYLAAGCADKTIYIWDSTSAERVRMWRTETCISLDFNHKGNLLASSGWDGYTRLWDFTTGRQMSDISVSGHILGFSPNDQSFATGGWDAGRLDIFEVASGQGLRTLYRAPEAWSEGYGRPLLDPSGRLLAFRTQEGLALWDVHTVQRISVLTLNKEKSLLGFDADGQNLLLTGPEGLFRCPITTPGPGEQRILGKPILVSPECADPVWGRNGWISHNGKICAVVGNNRCQLFRTDTFEKQAETGVQPGMRYSDISSDGSLFASGAWHYGGVRVWEAQTGALVKRLLTDDENKDASANVAFSPDGRFLVTATVSDYCFWQVGSWSLTRRIAQQPGNDFCPIMAFSRDGRMFAGTHSRNKICLYDAATGELLADLEAPDSKFVTGLAFNADGTQLLACESADALRLWDLREIQRTLTELWLPWDQAPPQANEVQAAAPGPATLPASSQARPRR